MLSPSVVQPIIHVLLAAGLLAAVFVDIRSHRIPNVITAPIAVCGLLLNGASGGWAGLQQSIGGLLLGVGILLPVWLSKGTGAGDVKLLGMVGALKGTQFVLWTGLLGAVAGGIIALLALAFRPGRREVLRNVGSHLFRFVVLRAPGEIHPTPSSFRMSYAVAIALGALGAALRAKAGW